MSKQTVISRNLNTLVSAGLEKKQDAKTKLTKKLVTPSPFFAFNELGQRSGTTYVHNSIHILKLYNIHTSQYN